MRVFKKIIKAILIIILVVITIFVLFAIYHNIANNFDSNKMYELGQNEKFIMVHNENMLVYDSGVGEETIVLLSGYGTGDPIIDFKPLTKLLNKKYRVIVIDYFGYGNSDDTNEERSIENICNEIHTVLNDLVTDAKYILMPHSISGIYSIYYASKYPGEIQAIIGIDNSVPLEYADFETPNMNLSLFKFIRYSGVVRIASLILPEMITPEAMNKFYTKEDLVKFRRQTVKNYMKPSLIEEMLRFQENGMKALKMELPKNIPLLFFITKKDKGEYGEEWYNLHEKTLEGYENGHLIEIEGTHYLHRTHSNEIAEKTIQFIEDVIQ